MKVMFAGPSGIGKSTLAKVLSDTRSLEFISGSVSDLLPKTKDISHQDMLSRDKKDLYMEDYQILNLRKKLYDGKDNFVTDRSFLDCAAYFYYKQADSIPACELEQFLEICKMCLNRYCTHLIFLPLEIYQVKDWVIEDNSKRITSGYFQVLISRIMNMILEGWNAKLVKTHTSIGKLFNNKPLVWGANEYILNSPYGETRIIEILELSQPVREILIQDFV